MIGELAALGDAWRRLVETALEPNAFYEPHFLLPALQHLADESVQIVVIEAAVRVCPDQGKVLCGLFPLQKKRSLRGLPFSTLEMWQNDYTFLTTPLIRAMWRCRPCIRSWPGRVANPVRFGICRYCRPVAM